MVCMSPIVFDTKNMEITNPKTWPSRLDDLSAYDQSSSDFSVIFVETWNAKACMSPVVFDNKNMEITNPKT